MINIEAMLARLRELAEIQYDEMPTSWPEIYPLMARYAEMQQIFRDLDEHLTKGELPPTDWTANTPVDMWKD